MTEYEIFKQIDTLSLAQHYQLHRIAAGRFRPYRGSWRSLFALEKKGLISPLNDETMPGRYELSRGVAAALSLLKDHCAAWGCPYRMREDIPMKARFAIMDERAYTDVDAAVILSMQTDTETLDDLIKERDRDWPGCPIVAIHTWHIVA